MPAATASTAAGDGETTDLSTQYDTPLGLAHTTMQALKDRIKLHYDLASDYYLNLWGEHIHHGYWPTATSKATDSKEAAQLNLIRLLLSISSLSPVAPPSEDDSCATTTTAAGTAVGVTTPTPAITLTTPATSATTTTDGANTTLTATTTTEQPRTPKEQQQQLRILDVGCGVGGTTRYLAGELGAAVTGITISGKQVQIAGRLSKAASSSTASGSVPAASSAVDGTPAAVDGNGAAAAQATNGDGDGSKKDGNKEDGDGFIPLGDKGGKVRFIELDAEKMGEFFSPGQGEGKEQGGFDVVWISEALSHFPNKALFFHNAHKLLRPGGKLVLADWFRAEGLGEGVFEADIKPIEDGMLLPPLCTQQEYVNLATGAGLEVLGGPKDISKDVSKTWDISWSLVQNPSLWAFAFSQGRDGIAFLQAFRAMRRGYANGSFRYAVMSFVKP